MSASEAEEVRRQVDALYRTDSRRVLATLIRLLGSFDLAEEALHDAFTAAVEQWPTDGVPTNPRAWLVSTGRFKAIDKIRRRARFDASLLEMAHLMDADDEIAPDSPLGGVEDDRLRLIFTCCHPALSPDAQVALTLREVCGLTTEEIARGFLTPAPTLAQRIVRAKSKIRVARIPYEVPNRNELPERLDSVLRVIYLVFNEGYYASAGQSLTRTDLSAEAIHLGRTVVDLLPEPEAIGLLALMLLTESRRAARATANGDIVLLEEQDRRLWHTGLIAEGTALVQAALTSRRFGPYTLQAAIAAVHAEATQASATDWKQIVGLYEVLATQSRGGDCHARRPRRRTRADRSVARARQSRGLSLRTRRKGRLVSPCRTNRAGTPIISACPRVGAPGTGTPIAATATERARCALNDSRAAKFRACRMPRFDRQAPCHNPQSRRSAGPPPGEPWLAMGSRGLARAAAPLILCGDINITRTDLDTHPKERKPGAIGQRPEERALFNALLGDDLVDIGRALDPKNPGLFTWWTPWRNMRQRNMGWRIDYILAAPSIAARARSCVVLAEIGTSDHAPVMMTFA